MKNKGNDTIPILVDLNILGSTELTSSQYFGVKATSLNTSKSLLKWIPDGFALSKEFVTRISLSLASKEELNELNQKFSSLSKSGIQKLIVRSSSTLEWLNGNSFAGLYSSVRGIQNFEELIAAIRTTYNSIQNTSFQSYAELKSIALPDEHLGILVQLEIPVSHSALIIVDQETAFVEYYNRDISNSVQGRHSPTCTIEKLGGKIIRRTSNNLFPVKLQEGIFQIIDEVRKIIKKNQTIHLEVGSDELNQFLFQINYLHNQQLTSYLPISISNRTYIENSYCQKIPLKAEAMNTFKEIGLFSDNLKIYKGLEIESLFTAICNDFEFKKGITIRYSYGDDISMPRGFFTDKNKAEKWLNQTYNSLDWVVIVHPYIEVRRSFELLLDKNECLLEHIPGMWESDNSFNPDVVFLNGNYSKAWIWQSQRAPLKGVFSADLNHYELPLKEYQIIKWQGKLKPAIEKLRLLYKELLPLNFHFVEDKNEAWFFLNMRKGFNLNLPEMAKKKTHILKGKADVLNWDRISPLQMQLTSERGEETEIVEIIKLLPKNSNQVIVIDFGLLSHPAMILREFGYKLIPSYLYSIEGKHSPNYSTIEFDIDADPVNRIMKEKSIYEDSDVKIVIDRDEIVDGHLLVVAKEPFTSLVEMENLSQKLKQIVKKLGKYYFPDNPMIIERGRARFCTSGFTESHAHAHILPKKMFNNNCELSFIERTKAKKMSSIKEAIKVARQSENEYILMISSKEEVYLNILPENTSTEKQLIRNFFKSQRKID